MKIIINFIKFRTIIRFNFITENFYYMSDSFEQQFLMLDPPNYKENFVLDNSLYIYLRFNLNIQTNFLIDIF